MLSRKANAVWEGTIGAGNGQMAFGSGAFVGEYSVPSRFDNGKGTNPEELIAAAHAGCFSMALSAELTKAGFIPEKIETNATLHIEKQDAGWEITKIHLESSAIIPGIEDSEFQKHASAAKIGCPVSKALAGVSEITLEATLK